MIKSVKLARIKSVKLDISGEEFQIIRSGLNKLVTGYWAEKGQIKDKINDLKTPDSDKVRLYNLLDTVNARLEDTLAVQNSIQHMAWKQGEDI